MNMGCNDGDVLLISLAYIFTMLIVSRILRCCIRNNMDDPQKCFALIIITCIESTAISCELQTVSDKFGLPMYFYLLLFLQLWWGLTRGPVMSSVDEIMEEVINDEAGVCEAVAIISTQILGFYLGYLTAKFFWTFQLTKEHKARICAKCTAGPKIRMWSGMLVEAIGVGLNKIAGKGCSTMELIPGVLLRTFALIYTVIAALDYTGGFFSPSLAMAMQFGCDEFRFFEHFVVYWLGPLLGSFGATYLLLLAVASRIFIKMCMQDGILKKTILEMIASSELCACCFEVVVVAEIYGISAGCTLTFILLLWWSFSWTKESGCPYRAFEDVIEGSIYPEEGLALIIAQVIGATFIYSYVQAFWELELTEFHAGRDFSPCTTDLKVDIYKGFLIEGVGTCIGRLVSRTVNDVHALTAGIVRSLCIISLVIAGADFTGGYYNPAVASAMKLGCQGTSIKDHLIVYWLGPFLGCFLSTIIFHLFCNQHKGKKGPSLSFFPDTIQYGYYQ